MTWTNESQLDSTWQDRGVYESGDIQFDADIAFDFYCPFDGFSTDPDSYWTIGSESATVWTKI